MELMDIMINFIHFVLVIFIYKSPIFLSASSCPLFTCFGECIVSGLYFTVEVVASLHHVFHLLLQSGSQSSTDLERDHFGRFDYLGQQHCWCSTCWKNGFKLSVWVANFLSQNKCENHMSDPSSDVLSSVITCPKSIRE